MVLVPTINVAVWRDLASAPRQWTVPFIILLLVLILFDLVGLWIGPKGNDDDDDGDWRSIVVLINDGNRKKKYFSVENNFTLNHAFKIFVRL